MQSNLAAAVAHFDNISRQMAYVVEAGTIEGRKAIIELRRANIAAIENLRQAAEALIAQLPGGRQQDIGREFQARFQEMFRIVAGHQGKWPAVLVAGDPEGFRASARQARDAKAALRDWLVKNLLPQAKE